MLPWAFRPYVAMGYNIYGEQTSLDLIISPFALTFYHDSVHVNCCRSAVYTMSKSLKRTTLVPL